MQNSILVQNLKCGGCAKTITNKISEIEHITNVSVDVDNSMISFFAENEESVLKVKEKLKTIGYPTINEDNTLASKAKSYVSCASGKLIWTNG